MVAFATIFWECASKNLTWSHLCECMVCAAPNHARCQPQHIVAGERFLWSRASASVEPGFTARARRCTQRTERNGGFGFQTKVKGRFLKQRRWTCWYSCRENMQVLLATASLVLLLFVFVLKSLLSLLFTSRYTMEAFLIFLYYYYLIPQCLLNIQLCISRYNTACDVSYAMPRLIRFC